MKNGRGHKFFHWFNDRAGLSEMIRPFREHLAPPDAKWNYVWGSSTLFCFLLQVITGISLAFLYQPSADAAYESLLHIENEVFLGCFIRGLHNWGASAMMVLLGIHMIRVYLMAAYKYPREMSWISGVVLLGLTMIMAMTGQLLRWDSNALWTGILVAEQTGRIPFIGDYIAYFFIGGTTLSGVTLSRYFAMHVFLFPALLMGVVGFHLYLVWRNGVSEPPKIGQKVDPATYRKWYQEMLEKKGVPFFPDAIWRDVLFALVVLILIILLAWIVGAPELTTAADPTILDTEPSPDWYFKWLYAIFATMNRHLEPYFLFFGPLIGIIFLFSIPFLSRGGERHPLRRPWAIAGVLLTIVMVGSLTYAGIKSPWVPHFDAKPLTYLASDSTASSLVRTGEKLFFQKKCIYCHSIGNRGGKKGPDLTQVQRRRDRAQITFSITNGSEDMPGYGGSLTAGELEAIVEYLTEENKIGGRK